MPFEIKKEAPREVLVTMGRGSVTIKPEVQYAKESRLDSGGRRDQEGAGQARASGREGTAQGKEVIQTSTEKVNGGKSMAEEKKLDKETGVKKIHQERADKQGPVGTGAEKAPNTDVGGEDVKIGNKEEKK